MNLDKINPMWILLAVAIIMLLFMKNDKNETFLDSFKDSLDVFTSNPILLVIIGLFIFMLLNKKSEGQKAITA